MVLELAAPRGAAQTTRPLVAVLLVPARHERVVVRRVEDVELQARVFALPLPPPRPPKAIVAARISRVVPRRQRRTHRAAVAARHAHDHDAVGVDEQPGHGQGPKGAVPTGQAAEAVEVVPRPTVEAAPVEAQPTPNGQIKEVGVLPETGARVAAPSPRAHVGRRPSVVDPPLPRGVAVPVPLEVPVPALGARVAARRGRAPLVTEAVPAAEEGADAELEDPLGLLAALTSPCGTIGRAPHARLEGVVGHTTPTTTAHAGRQPSVVASAGMGTRQAPRTAAGPAAGAVGHRPQCHRGRSPCVGPCGRARTRLPENGISRAPSAR